MLTNGVEITDIQSKKEGELDMPKPRIYVATPCYDSMRVETCVSLIDMFSTLGKHGI